MKEIFKIFQFLLLMYGVFGADEVKSVSVMEGDSVTLNPDPAKIQGFNQILWRFGSQGSTIASIVGKKISYEDEEIFEDRLQLDQTGSLTIKNMRTKHSGRYKADISHSNGTLFTIFIVTVYESLAVIDAGVAEMKLMSVMEGNPVILQTDIPQIQGDELIVWRSGEEGKLIAKHDIEAKSPPLYDEEERFRDRLKLNDQTGSLIITNTRTTDSGLYKVKISSKKQTLYKRFTVTVSVPGLSGGAVAGIVVGVLLAAAVAAGVMYYLRPRTTNLPNQTWSVPMEDDVPLNPETEIQTGDVILWLFGAEETLIAEIKGENREMTTHEGPDEIFKNRLKLDETTGSLTIEFILTKHAGLYTLKIRRGRETFYKRFMVSVSEKRISVMEGCPVLLNSDTNIQKGDEVQWLFGYKEPQTVIAEIKNTEVTDYEGTDERFRDGLELDEETGSLTIRNSTAAHQGYYTLKITRGRVKIYKRLYISVTERMITKTEGESVTLKPAKNRKINKDDLIRWLFGDEEQQTLIAEINGKTGEILTRDDVADERFRDMLELDETTRSLTITNTRTEHSGVYKLQIRSSSGVSEQTFSVTVRVEEILLKGGDSVTLNPDTEIQRDDQILWMFGDQDKLIAQMKGGTVDIYDGVNKRFRGRLKLDKMTGSLTITKIEAEHTGLYKLMIISSSRVNLVKRFKVSLQPRYVAVTAGDSVHLNTDLTEIQRDDEIQWRFGDENSLIAEIKGGTGVTHDVPDERFRDRLELNKKTGDLIIKNSRDEHTGPYKLKISSSEGNTNMRYIVTIKERYVAVTAGESVRLHTGLTKIQRDEEIQWRFGKENSLIAEIKGGTGVTHDGPDERFRGRLELNKKTGDLIIKNSTTKHTGEYKLKISSSEGNTNMRFIVTITERYVAVTAGESVRLHTDLTEIQTDDEIEWRFGDKNSLIAEIKGGTGETHDGPGKRFRDRLELDEKTGDLIIKNSTAEHTGEYKLKISSSEGNTNRTYIVTITERYVAVTAGESVRLHTDLTEIQTDDEIEWRFGNKNSLIAEIKGGTGVTHDGPDERFRDRLKLDEMTGDLIIKNSTAEHTGEYKLKICSSKGNTNRTYIVTITARKVEVTPGESVRLYTDLNEIQTEDEIQWRFGDKNSLIAKIKGGTGVTYDGPDERFRDRLELDETTGVLIIKNSTAQHAGEYKLKIRRSEGTTNSKYSVTIRDAAVTNEARTESSMKEKTDSRRNRVNESVTVEMPLLDGENVDVVNEEEGTSLL